MLRVSQATSHDIEVLVGLLGYLFEQEEEFKPNHALQKKGLALILENDKIGAIFVLKDHDMVIGMVSLLWSLSTAMGGRVAILEDMILQPDYRGKGCGKMLLQHAIEYAKEHKCKRVTLLTDTKNHSAQEFYGHFGFQESSMKAMRLYLEE